MTGTQPRRPAQAGSGWTSAQGPGIKQGRRSEVRVNRVLRVDPGRVRRVSVSVSQETFDAVVREMRRRLS